MSVARVGLLPCLFAACQGATAAGYSAPEPDCRPPGEPYVQAQIAENAGWDAERLGLPSLARDTLPAGEREVRLWAVRSFVGNVALLRLRAAGDSVTGELVVFNSEFGPSQQHPINARWCDRIVEGRGRRACVARFPAPVRWDSLLAVAEANEVWTLPDGSTVPREPEMADGGGIRVETRRGGCYRAYGYGAPFVESVPEYRHAGVLEQLVLRLDGRWGAAATDSVRR